MFLTLFAAFEVDQIYLAVDGLSGVRNLSWLLAYLCLAVAVHFFGRFCSRGGPRWMLPALVVTGCLLVLAFPFGPGGTPEQVNHYVPNNVGEIVFTGAIYGYVSAVVSLACLRSFLLIFRRERKRFLVRLRMAAGVGAAVASVLFYAHRFFIYSSSLFLSAVQPYADGTGADVGKAVTVVAFVLWAVHLGASDRFYLAVARPARYLQKLLILRDLRALRGRVERLCPAVLTDSAPWLYQLGDPDHYISQCLIAILDGKKMLAGYLDDADRRDDLPEGIADGFDALLANLEVAPPAWDAEETAEAERLHRAFQAIADAVEYEELVNAYREPGRAVRRGRPVLVMTNPATRGSIGVRAGDGE
jgi:hypothetical protein